jgi:hypothetical protein
VRIARPGFSVETALGEFCVRTRRRGWLVALAVEVHLIGWPGNGNRWAFVQLGDKTLWLWRS